MTVSPYAELGPATMGAQSRPPRPRLQILVLDDDETDRLRLQRVILQAGLEVDLTEAPDIEVFRGKLRLQGYDVVFIDFWLNFESGLDALHLLMAEPRQARAVPIMLSRAVAPEVIIEAMRAGCADYIVKDTLDVDALRACIAAAFERRVLLAAMRESQDLRRAIRRLVERLGKGQVPGRAADGPASRPGMGLSGRAAQRLSSGILADLEVLWQLRRDHSPS